ncbi:AMP-binding protein (plasmid) [Aliiroseovarius crassostreae]|uniref:AMP-binding protein n=1 Tax=Aliiroseovarius crassostreae TaxID=154981 RepID=UPI00220DB21F|nr:AMP-binding protein [Aliiroseovarius crassostreae]UWQ12776.1 AMP-binding protein [Aliiroseovarius crassostreae]
MPDTAISPALTPRNTDQIPSPTSGPGAFFQQLQGGILATPDAKVFGADGQAVHYPDLLATIAKLAVKLPASSPLCDQVVAICTQKTPAGLAAVLAALAAGQAYAPLDPTHPSTRLLHILDDLHPAALIVDDVTAPKLLGWAEATGTLLINLSTLSDPIRSKGLPPTTGPSQTLAAVLHTSGSTGTPKRVEITASALDVFQDWVVQELDLRPGDCLLSHAPFAFDLSFLDIYASLMAGANLVLADAQAARNGARLLTLLNDCKVTIWHSAPSALKLLAETAATTVFPDLRCVLFAGEPMPDKTLQRLFHLFPNARFINIYGCTETNDTFFYDVPRHATPSPLPLGAPLPYVDYLIIDPAGIPLTGPCEGELWVRCPTMMRGYGNAALTARAMVHHKGRRYFRSGDQVRRDATGCLHFVGRNDSMVKLSGVRVDLNEIETLLLSHPKVGEAACFLTETAAGKELNAWISTSSNTAGAPDLTTLDLRKHLAAHLPAASLPRRYEILSEPLPKNSNGKTCRKQLAVRAMEDIA